MLKVNQDVVVVSKNGSEISEYLGDVEIWVSGSIREPWTILPEQKITLTKSAMIRLIDSLTKALELVNNGENFIVHHNGDISVSVDYETSNYASIDDYKNGVVITEN